MAAGHLDEGCGSSPCVNRLPTAACRRLRRGQVVTTRHGGLQAKLASRSRCPVDMMPARETRSNYFKGRCATTLEQCLGNCRAGDANDCYASALVLQEIRNSPVSEALFPRACTLGVVSRCTNRAAVMDLGHGTCLARLWSLAMRNFVPRSDTPEATPNDEVFGLPGSPRLSDCAQKQV
jgi:hypothetical protein